MHIVNQKIMLAEAISENVRPRATSAGACVATIEPKPAPIKPW